MPEIADYEVRRELLRNSSARALKKLDQLNQTLSYVPLTTNAIRKAAEFWAQARMRGKPAADRHALDGDVILCAQAKLAIGEDDELVVATTNLGHLAQFVSAKPWSEITP